MVDGWFQVRVVIIDGFRSANVFYVSIGLDFGERFELRSGCQEFFAQRLSVRLQALLDLWR